MLAAEQQLAAHRRLSVQVAVSYGGRWDILQAVRSLAAECQRGALRPDEIDETRFADALALTGLPDPDLFIRTGGEQRISNFLLWNLAYSELWFTATLWPDFAAAHLEQAFSHFASRQRRFGLTGAQAEARAHA
jgi:undecaprenyl diphosphate synthase